MKSHAAVSSHPLHAMLIPFPFAFLVGAVFFDAIGLLGGLPNFWLVGHYLLAAGIITALAAAIPGIIDYATTVPPRSSAKKRAATHGLTNSFAVALFATAWFSRSLSEPDLMVLVLEAAGAAALSSGAWMGGTLVYRNQIGVDHRYARAGKWRESTISVPRGDFVTVADADELKPGQMKLLHLNGRRWVVARTADGESGGRWHLRGLRRSLSASRRIAGGRMSGRWDGAVPVAWLAVRGEDGTGGGGTRQGQYRDV